MIDVFVQIINDFKFKQFLGEAGGYCTCPDFKKLGGKSKTEREDRKIQEEEETRNITSTAKGRKKIGDGLNGEKPTESTASEKENNTDANPSEEEENGESEENSVEDSSSEPDFSKDYPQLEKNAQGLDLGKILQPTTDKKSRIQKKTKTKVVKLEKDVNSTETIWEQKEPKNEELEEVDVEKSRLANEEENQKRTKNLEKPETELDSGIRKMKLGGESRAKIFEEEIPEKKRIPGGTAIRPKEDRGEISGKMGIEREKVKSDGRDEAKHDGKITTTLDDAAEIERIKKLLEEKVVELRNKEDNELAKPGQKVSKSEARKKKKKSKLGLGIVRKYLQFNHK